MILGNITLSVSKAGILVCVLAGCFYIAWHLLDLDEIYLISAHFVLFAGIGLFVFGVMSTAFAMNDDKSIAYNDEVTVRVAMLRCMVAMSVSDNELDPSEIKKIEDVFFKLTGDALGEGVVYDVAKTMLADGVNMGDELRAIKDVLNPDLKKKIMTASFIILAADGVVDESERELIEEIRKSLGFPKGETKRMEKDMLRSIQKKKARKKKSNA